jgi:hypothetical protein
VLEESPPVPQESRLEVLEEIHHDPSPATRISSSAQQSQANVTGHENVEASVSTEGVCKTE